jgi:hypothetical protein
VGQFKTRERKSIDSKRRGKKKSLDPTAAFKSPTGSCPSPQQKECNIQRYVYVCACVRAYVRHLAGKKKRHNNKKVQGQVKKNNSDRETVKSMCLMFCLTKSETRLGKQQKYKRRVPRSIGKLKLKREKRKNTTRQRKRDEDSGERLGYIRINKIK